MADETSSNSIIESRVFQLLTTVYGPYAFGVASLLIIWYAIVSPQLSRQAVDFEKSAAVTESMRVVVQNQEQVSRQLERTATILEAIIDKLNIKANGGVQQ